MYKKLAISFIFCLSLIMLAACGKTEPPEEEEPVKKTYTVESYVTLGNKEKLLNKEADKQTDLNLKASGTKIRLDPSKLYQEMDGFGAALTESSAVVISGLDETSKQQVLEDLFGDSGISMSFMRLTIGASDFSLNNYTYNDTEDNIPDLELANFSIDREKEKLIPLIKEAVSLNPELNIMASPWSAPAWMKGNKSLNGGSLLDQYIDVYAEYFVKYLKAMAEEGVEIYAVTPQNEPLHQTSGYPSMYMLPNQQINLIVAMGKRFVEENIKTLIMAYDHNWDRMDYPITVTNSKAKDYVAGAALHGYGGEVKDTGRYQNAFPDKGIWFTEISGGLWATNFADNITWSMENIFIGSIKYGAKGVLMWNIALDENQGPKNGGCTNCRGVLTINSQTGEVIKNEEYYTIGHFSKFIRNGARKIESTVSNQQLLQAAFLNPDGSIVLVVHNKTKIPQSFSISIHSGEVVYSLPGQGTQTFIFYEN